ncbi:MAG: M20/M25/M40 family metallo-hydrolase [Planctomycetota bacterium]
MLLPLLFAFAPATNPATATPRELSVEQRIEAEVTLLSTEYADRDPTHPETYAASAKYLEGRLLAMDYEVKRQAFSFVANGVEVESVNLIADVPGKAADAKVLIVGAHYDTVPETPGADDNASGVVGLLELADRLKNAEPEHTIRFVFWANEEPPYFRTELMGSVVHAKSLGDQDVLGAISLDMIGYFDEAPGSQRIPDGLELPGVDPAVLETATFLVVLGEPGSVGLVQGFASAWESEVPLVPVVLPKVADLAGLSDHWSYWQEGYPAVQITDTSFLRNPHYHTDGDTPDTLDYERMAAGIDGIESALRALAKTDPE